MSLSIPTREVVGAAGTSETIERADTERTAAARVSTWPRSYYLTMLLLAAVSLWLRTGFSIVANPHAGHDDALFVRLARSLETGHWLGLYDDLTLAKGMVYPLFIVVAFWISVPLKIAEHGVYLFASCLTARTVGNRGGGARLSLILFGLLAFNPVVWDFSFTRVLRQDLYMSLSLALVTLVVIIAFPDRNQPGPGSRKAALQGCALGFVAAAYWMTREEGLWLIPSAVVVLGMAVLTIAWPDWRPPSEGRSMQSRPSRLQRLALALAVAIVTFTSLDFLVAEVNHHHYGIFETNEFRTGSFLRAYGAISRIKHDHWRPFILFPRDARQRAYDVSPAARELESSLEGEVGKRWLQNSCPTAKTVPCDEVEMGWAVWEFRDAVAAAGHYRSGAEAMRYYEALADQINTACAQGAIPCLPPRATLFPPFRWQYVSDSLQASKRITSVLFRMAKGYIGSIPPVLPDGDVAIFRDTVGDVYSPEKDKLAVTGWVMAAGTLPTLRIANSGADPVDSSIIVVPAPDLLASYPAFRSVRFALRTDCPTAACDLILDLGASQPRISFDQLLHPERNSGLFKLPGIVLHVETVARVDSHRFTDSRRAVQVKIARAIASVYATVFPTLAAFGVAGLLAALLFRRRFPMPTALLALGLASMAAVGTLIVLLSYLAASSDFTVDTVLYTSPASPFVITLTAIGNYSWILVVRHGHRRINGQPQRRPVLP